MCEVTYGAWPGRWSCQLDMTARTDRPTDGQPDQSQLFQSGRRCARARNILDHQLTVAADHFLAIDAGAIPLPQPPTCGRRHALRLPGRRRRSARGSATTIRSCGNGSGYDHNFCLDRRSGEPALRRAARSAASGRVLELSDQSARPAGLFRKLSRRFHCRKGRPPLSAVRRHLPRTARLAGYAQPARFPDRAACAGRGLSAHHRCIASRSFGRRVPRSDGAATEWKQVPTSVLCGERCHLGEGPDL